MSFGTNTGVQKPETPKLTNGSKPNGDILMEITMPSKKEVWVTTDGQQFNDLKDAEYYELRSTVAEHFNALEDDALWGDYHKVPGGDIVDFLENHQGRIREFYKNLKDLQK
jgi:hypothetical protein